MNNRKTILLILVFGVAALGMFVAGFFTWSSSKGSKIGASYPVSAAFSTAIPFSDNSVLLSNGYSFVSYNYLTGVIARLSPSEQVDGLNSIDSVSISSDKRYILFHSLLSPEGSVLESPLVERKLSTDLDYWWLYDQTSQKFTPLDQGISQAKIFDDHIYAISGLGQSQTMRTLNFGLQEVSKLTVPASSNFAVANQTFYLQTADDKVISTKDGTVSTVLSDGAYLLSAVQDSVIFINKDHVLMNFNATTQSAERIAKDITGTPVLGRGYVGYLTGSSANGIPVAWVYNMSSGKKQLLNITKDAGTTSSLAAIFDEKVVITQDDSGSYHLIGNDLKPINDKHTLGAPTTQNTAPTPGD